MGSPAESARLLTVLERVGEEFDNQNAVINDDFVQRVREFRIQQEKLNEAFQRLIVDNSDAIIRFLQLMLQIMERLVPVIDTVIKTISLIPTEAFELGAIAAFAPSLLPNYIARKGFAKLTQKPATIYQDDLRFTPPNVTRPPAPQLQQQEKEANDRAEKQEQKLF
jgi:predicted transcriptional regulator